MGGVLRADPVWIEVFTGLRADRFARLLRVVRERGGEHPRMGRPWRLPLAERVLLVAVYYRTNLTMRQLAVLSGVCPATVCRTIQQAGPLLSLEPAPRPEGAVERLWIVDGTLIAVRDGTVAASSRNYRFSANVQVVIDADTWLVVATAPGGGQRRRRQPFAAPFDAGYAGAVGQGLRRQRLPCGGFYWRLVQASATALFGGSYERPPYEVISAFGSSQLPATRRIT